MSEIRYQPHGFEFLSKGQTIQKLPKKLFEKQALYGEEVLPGRD
jgi:hypothetical protein